MRQVNGVVGRVVGGVTECVMNDSLRDSHGTTRQHFRGGLAGERAAVGVSQFYFIFFNPEKGII